jgi:tetratricopeptide (TPR) repeat protein
MKGIVINPFENRGILQAFSTLSENIMFNLKYLIAILAFAVIGFSAISGLSQTTQPIRGVVKVRDKDGKETPVAGALVETYRTDIGKGAGPSTTTDKKGTFSFVGFQLGNMYAIAVSGPGISPVVQPNIKAGMEDITIVASVGDGRKPSEDDVRAFVASPAAKGNVDPKTQAKEDAEYQKKLATYNAEKSKAENANKIVNAAYQEGDKLYKAKDYNAAIAKFDEGINADPEFEGSAPVLLNYKAVALKDRGIVSFNQSISTADADAKAALLAKAKTDLTDAAASLDKALLILKNAPAAADATAQKSYDSTRRNVLFNYVDVYRLLVKTHTAVDKAKEAPAVFQQYLAVETDPQLKLNAQLVLGDMMQEAGEAQAAIDAYMAVLQTAPDNVDALAGVGFSLVNQGYLTNDKTKFQEGVNYLQKFVGAAPDTNKFKSDAVALIDALKKDQNVTPQKVTAPARKRP